MAWCLIVAGCCFLISTDVSARVPLIAFFVYLFTAFYSPGIGPVPFVYVSEAFPLSHREIGVAFCVCWNNTIGSILSLTFPSLLDKTTPTGGKLFPRAPLSSLTDNLPSAFGFYAGLNMLAFVVILFCLPETKYVLHFWFFCKRSMLIIILLRQRTLEELDYIFGVPTRRHAAYHLRTWIPWWIKRYIFFQSNAKLEPLYHLEGFSGGNTAEAFAGH